MKKLLFLVFIIIFSLLFVPTAFAEDEEIVETTLDETIPDEVVDVNDEEVVTEESVEVIDETVEDEESLDSPFLLNNETEETSNEASLLDEEVKLHSLSSLGLPRVTILPTSPFYPFKLAFEQVVLFFSFSPEKKAEATLKGAEKRLSEVYRLVEEKQYAKANEVMEKYNEQISSATTLVSQLQDVDQEAVTQYVRKIEANTVKQQSIADFFAEKAYFDPDAVARIRMITVLGIEKAIEALVENNVATPSFELKKRIQEVINGENYDEETKTNVETKMNEKLRREIRKQEQWETTSSAGVN